MKCWVFFPKFRTAQLKFHLYSFGGGLGSGWEREVAGSWTLCQVGIDGTLHSQLADYYYEERICILRCVLHLLTYFQDERHPYTVSTAQMSSEQAKDGSCGVKSPRVSMWEVHGLVCSFKAQYFQCIEKLDKELVPNYRKQFEALYKAEAPTWETHGNLMVFCFLLLFARLIKLFLIHSVLENTSVQMQLNRTFLLVQET